jgi:hypothetical protein
VSAHGGAEDGPHLLPGDLPACPPKTVGG